MLSVNKPLNSSASTKPKEWAGLALKRVPLYVFPAYLAVTEYFVDQFLVRSPGSDTIAPISIVGPTIVAAGMVLLFPILIPKPPDFQLSASVQAVLKKNNLVVHTTTSQNIMLAAWIFLFLSASAWVYTLYVSNKQELVTWHTIPITMLVGGIVYMIGIIFTELRGI
jgi:hypothetical protein